MRFLWQRFAAAVFVLSLAALGWLGREIYLAAPPIPEVVRAQSGETLFTGEQIPCCAVPSEPIVRGIAMESKP